MKFYFRFFALLGIGLFLGQDVAAQVEDLNRRASTAAFYYHADEGDLTMRANVWGAVRFPGRYEVRQGTTLAELYSLAGGPFLTAHTERETPIFTVTLSRIQNGERVEVLNITSENMGDVLQEMTILEGDVLLVDTMIEQQFDWTRLIPVLSALATIALIVERISN